MEKTKETLTNEAPNQSKEKRRNTHAPSFRSLAVFSSYLIVNIINRAIPFFLLPVITVYLVPEQMGYWSIFQVMISLSLPLIGLNSYNTITRKFFRQSNEESAKLIGNILLVLLVTSAIWTVVLFFLRGLLHNALGINGIVLMSLTLIGLSNSIIHINLTVLRNLEKPKTYGAFEISRTALNIVVALILVASYRIGWTGMVWGVFVSSICFAALSIYHLIKTDFLKFRPEKVLVKEILVISIPLTFHSLSSIVISLSDRIFLKNMAGPETVGLYSVGYTFGMIIMLATDSFNKAWTPWMYRTLSHITDEKKKRIVLYTYGYFIAVCIIALIVTVIGKLFLKYFIDVQYSGSTVYIGWVSLAYVFQGMYFMVFPYFVFVGKTNFLPISTGSAAVVNLLCNYFFIKQFGAIGAAYATIASYLLMFVLCWWYSNRIYPMPWFSFLRKDFRL